MEPKVALEYVLTTEMATDIQRSLLRFVMRHGWRHDLPLILGGCTFALLLGGLVAAGWLLPAVGGAILFLAALFILCTIYGRRWRAYTAATSAVVALHTSDRRVRIELHEQRACMETEYFRGEAAWSELEELVVFPNFWALRFSNSGHIVIPSALVTPEVKALLEAKAEQVLAVIDRQ